MNEVKKLIMNNENKIPVRSESKVIDAIHLAKISLIAVEFHHYTIFI